MNGDWDSASTASDGAADGRKPYEPPRLTVHGAILDLTRGANPPGFDGVVGTVPQA